MTFQIHGLNPSPFAPLFEQTDGDLAKRNITRCFADTPQGFPCRVSLEEAPVGDELLLLNYEQRWSRKFGPVVKVDRMKKVMIQNEETKEPFA